MQERRNSSALAMELRLSCTNTSIWQVSLDAFDALVLQVLIICHYKCINEIIDVLFAIYRAHTWNIQDNLIQLKYRPFVSVSLFKAVCELAKSTFLCHTCGIRMRLKHKAWTKWSPFFRQHFQMYSLDRKLLQFDWNFTEACYSCSKPCLIHMIRQISIRIPYF